jgi:hypothetical protein
VAGRGVNMGILDDSRLKGYNGKKTHPVLSLERTFCSECGKPWGWTSQESSQHIAAAEIIVYCDRCFEKLNKLAGTPVEPIPASDLARLGLIDDLSFLSS